jgi:hypothetical protein
MAGFGSDEVDTLLVEVRAGTQGFAQDIAAMRSTFDNTLVDGFARAGDVLERGLLGAIRRGSLGFDDLKRVALNVVNDIAAQATQGLFGALPGGATGSGGGIGGLLGGVLGSLLGLPGRATGGPVGPGRGYIVGERGPELFVPTSSGRVLPNGGGSSGGGREVRVSINLVAAPGQSGAQALQRSSRQVASAVRRALAQN